jgi:hypothetical protein
MGMFGSRGGLRAVMPLKPSQDFLDPSAELRDRHQDVEGEGSLKAVLEDSVNGESDHSPRLAKIRTVDGLQDG